jgi:hypothetical protein
MITESFFVKKIEDIYFIPIHINYERLVEANMYPNELYVKLFSYYLLGLYCTCHLLFYFFLALFANIQVGKAEEEGIAWRAHFCEDNSGRRLRTHFTQDWRSDFAEGIHAGFGGERGVCCTVVVVVVFVVVIVFCCRFSVIVDIPHSSFRTRIHLLRRTTEIT